MQDVLPGEYLIADGKAALAVKAASEKGCYRSLFDAPFRFKQYAISKPCVGLQASAKRT